MYDAPCSRMGHIYRKFAPFSSNGIGNYLGRVCNVNSFSKLDLHWDISSYPRIVVSTNSLFLVWDTVIFLISNVPKMFTKF